MLATVKSAHAAAWNPVKPTVAIATKTYVHIQELHTSKEEIKQWEIPFDNEKQVYTAVCFSPDGEYLYIRDSTKLKRVSMETKQIEILPYTCSEFNEIKLYFPSRHGLLWIVEFLKHEVIIHPWDEKTNTCLSPVKLPFVASHLVSLDDEYSILHTNTGSVCIKNTDQSIFWIWENIFRVVPNKTRLFLLGINTSNEVVKLFYPTPTKRNMEKLGSTFSFDPLPISSQQTFIQPLDGITGILFLTTSNTITRMFLFNMLDGTLYDSMTLEGNFHSCTSRLFQNKLYILMLNPDNWIAKSTIIIQKFEK